MTIYSCSNWYWNLALASFLVMGGALAELSIGITSFDCALAQITPDATLGAESSVITPNVDINGLPIDQIDGGAQRGANLFHSFQEFNIDEGRGAYFTNPDGIENILSRVTGNDPSDILGTLGLTGGDADLFLMNPNGIVFGPNASLDVGGSFVASTASSLSFADGTEFSTTNPQSLPLLKVSVPTGLQFGSNAGRILVQGNGQGTRATSDLIDTTFGLRVWSNQTLALVGGDVALEGGTLKTAGGRIELGSVTGPGLVSLTPVEKGWTLGYSGVPTFGDVQLSQQATMDASGAGGGDVQVRGKQVTLRDGSQIEASTLGSKPGGTLNVTALESVEAIGLSADSQFASGLFALVYPGATGDGGNLTIETGRLIVRDGAWIFADTYGSGNGGEVLVRTTEAVTLSDDSWLSADALGLGTGGDLKIETGQLIVQDGSRVTTNTDSEGNAGNLTVRASDSVEVIGESADSGRSTISVTVMRGATGAGGDLTIETGRLSVRDGAQLRATTFGEGSAGTLAVRASDSVELIGRVGDGETGTGFLTSVQSGATGDGGDLIVETGRLIIRNGQIGAGTYGEGSGGTLTVRASDSVELSAPSEADPFVIGIYTAVEPGATGNGGDLTIETGRLIVGDGAVVSSATRPGSTGTAGTLTVRASSMELVGRPGDGKPPTGLFARTEGAGDAKDLRVLTNQLTVRDGAEVTVSSQGIGKAGNLEVAARSVSLDNQGKLVAESASGQGGNITLQNEDLLLLNGKSAISATAGTAGGGGDGGNITIDTDLLVALENSDITANAFEGRGGKVQINTQGDFRSLDSDITASSQLGPQFEGVVEINTPDVDVQRSLTQLSANFVSPEQVVAGSCLARRNVEQGSFTVTGTGGLPRSPYEAISGRYPVTSVQPIQGSSTVSSRAAAVETAPWRRGDPIQEAQGMAVTADGRTLVGTTPQLVALAKAQNLVCHSD